MSPPALREGFTTGTAATAAATAALHLALTGQPCDQCMVVLPPLDASAPSLTIPVWRSGYGCGYGCPPAAAPLPTVAPHKAGDNTGREADATAASAPPCPTLRVPRCPQNSAPLCAWAEVEKDGGDDPDATRHAHIVATVTLPATREGQHARVARDTENKGGTGQHKAPDAPCNTAFSTLYGDGASGANAGPSIRISGGAGVGRVTLPGLPIAVGEAAINPVPLQQITHALRALAHKHGYTGPIEVCIAVPEGEELARRTLNARLGIIGGISILGTQGTVKPFSHSAWQATISQGLSVAAASHCQQICLSTGRRSERLLMELYPHLPALAFIQAADFAQFSLSQAGQGPFTTLVWGCFFGKLLKLAEGHPYTHAHKTTLDMRVLSAWCAEYKAACAPAIATCITAGHALELLLDDSAGMDILRHVAQRAATHARLFAGKDVRIHLFHIQGQELLTL